MIKTLRSKTFASKYDGSLCRRCSKPISVGTMIRRAEGFGYEHDECPLRTLTERAEGLATKALADRVILDNLFKLESEALAEDIGPTALVATALEVIADRLLDEYDAAQYKAGQDVARELVQEGVLKPLVQKGIYRVSLTGLEKRYGLDYVNVQLTPNPKYGSIKVGEYHGESLGRITREGNFVFWPSYEDRTSTRTQALLAALDIIQGSQDPIEYAKAYAIESGTCFRCGADLVDEKSRERLLGPECFRRFQKGG